MIKLLLISTWFQIIWLMAVIGAESLQWLTLACVLVTYAIERLSQGTKLAPLLLIAAVGIVLDNVNHSIGVIEFSDNRFPLWLAALWFAFAWFAYYLAELVRRYPLRYVALAGGIAGAASYFTGAQLGDVLLREPLFWTLAILMVQWLGVIWLILKVYRYEE
ncbi:DUF2878 domain-containing protein [Vibrio sp.]|uniref:DUF2878 domain-containing protein n=1 Tax=Vibrio sp. TaxID=678 RepID=UPI003D0D98BD